MKYKNAPYLGLIILLECSFIFILNVNIFTQSTADAPPKIKDFGSSLKKFEKKDKDKSKDNQNNTDNSDEETIRVKTDLVVSDVLVVNQKGNVIAGLKKDDFVVKEDGTPQEVGIFAFGENTTIPRSIVLIIDYSGSQLPYIKNSIESTKLLVDKLSPNDRMAIVTDDVKILVNFTKDKKLLKNKLDSLYQKVLDGTTGRSEQYTALLAVLNEMFDEEDIRPIVILQSDGDELFALKMDKNKKDESPPIYNGKIMGIRLKNYSFEEVRSIVDKSRATIYSIIPGFRILGLSQEEKLRKMRIINENSYKFIASTLHLPKITPPPMKESDATNEVNWYEKQQLALLEISKLSGAYLSYLENPEDSESIYSDIFTTINNRYVIGYYPTNQSQNGKKHIVTIEVKEHPEYIVMGRKTYYTPEQGIMKISTTESIFKSGGSLTKRSIKIYSSNILPPE